MTAQCDGTQAHTCLPFTGRKWELSMGHFNHSTFRLQGASWPFYLSCSSLVFCLPFLYGILCDLILWKIGIKSKSLLTSKHWYSYTSILNSLWTAASGLASRVQLYKYLVNAAGKFSLRVKVIVNFLALPHCEISTCLTISWGYCLFSYVISLNNTVSHPGCSFCLKDSVATDWETTTVFACFKAAIL